MMSTVLCEQIAMTGAYQPCIQREVNDPVPWRMDRPVACWRFWRKVRAFVCPKKQAKPGWSVLTNKDFRILPLRIFSLDWHLQAYSADGDTKGDSMISGSFQNFIEIFSFLCAAHGIRQYRKNEWLQQFVDRNERDRLQDWMGYDEIVSDQPWL